MKNRFILDYLRTHNGATREYSLLAHIETEQPNFFDSLEDNPSLYKKHFYLFNKLYHLSEEMKGSGEYLDISPIEIRVLNYKTTKNKLAEADPLKAFYLDKKNLNLSEKEVSEMLTQFWEKYLAIEEKSESIQILQLQGIDVLSKEIVKKQFNRLALKLHPDKGGNQDEFDQLKKAYNSLKKLYQ